MIKYFKIKGDNMSKIIVDGNTATANIAFKLSQVIPVYPITPSSAMAEYCTGMASRGEKNIWGENVKTVEMQSEAGVAGTLHGALLEGAYATSFTCSQGLLLMLPNMFKIAGEGLPGVLHVSSRTVATHALCIFGDHSDVMAVRSAGWGMICSSNVQEAQDMALASHLVAMEYKLPILHFFDGFRTSHEIQKIEGISDEDIRSLLPENTNYILTPDNPRMFGTAQNPDVFFQNREGFNKKYANFTQKFKEVLSKIEGITGRHYAPFEYFGNKNAKNIIVSMASSTEVLRENLPYNIGLIKVRQYRPFDVEEFLNVLPSGVKKITIMDRCKENGTYPPLYADVSNAVQKLGKKIDLISCKYGLGGKDFTPACVNAIVKNMKDSSSKKDVTVGIIDDVTFKSLPLEIESKTSKAKEIKIYGLGSDGSVSASKSLIKILGRNSNKYVQGYFEYDSKKSGSMTISHLRLSNEPIKSCYLLHSADIISINNFSFVHRYNCLDDLKENGIVLINSIFNKDEIGRVLPNNYVRKIKETNARLFVINAQKYAKMSNLKEKINIIMQSALFKVAHILNLKTAEKEILNEIQKTFSSKGIDVVKNNIQGMKFGFKEVEEVDVSSLEIREETKKTSPEGFQQIMNKTQTRCGNSLPVSVFEANGSMPTDTAKYEKRGIAVDLPIWLPENCIQCGQCVMACPHGALRAILVEEKDCPENIPFANAIGLKGHKYRIQLSPEDCTGCGVCYKTCPSLKKAIEMAIAEKTLDIQKKNYAKLEEITSKKAFSDNFPKGLQFNQTYFQFSGACAGCGETPYIKLASMLFGEKMIIANATGCSSIYCGSFPSCPFSKNKEGKGPAWANSLFEDNAEFGLGIKLATEYTNNRDKSVWIIGGDGWADDIGFGGLDHVLQSNANVNILVLDNENYANTGGQASKSTPLGAKQKFAENGKTTRKKNLGFIAMSYKNAYVAQVSLGADMTQCIRAFKEAEAFDGPSIIIAYSPCVNHGYDMSETMTEMKKAVEYGYWNLYRYNPNIGLTLDYTPVVETQKFTSKQRRFKGSNELLEQNNQQAKENLAILRKFTDKNKI